MVEKEQEKGRDHHRKATARVASISLPKVAVLGVFLHSPMRWLPGLVGLSQPGWSEIREPQGKTKAGLSPSWGRRQAIGDISFIDENNKEKKPLSDTPLKR